LESKHQKSYYKILAFKGEKPISVLFFSHSSQLGGAERSLLDMIRGLQKRGVICNCVVPGNGPLRDKLIENGCGVLTFQVETDYSWWWCASNLDDLFNFNNTFKLINDFLLPEIEKIKPDFILSQTIVSPWGAYCAEILNIKHITSAREYGELDHGLNFLFGFQDSMTALYKSSDYVFAVSNDVSRILFADQNRDKIDVIYSSIHLPDVADTGQEKYGVIDSAFRIGIFATFQEGKGQIDLINATLNLMGKGIDLECYCVGRHSDNLYIDELCRIIQKSSLQHRIHLIDHTDDPYELMKKMNVIVSCSGREALGRTILEAVCLEIPIIFPDTGGHAEIFKDGVHGLSYTPGNFMALSNCLEDIYNNRDVAQKRCQAAKKYIQENFNSDNYDGRVYNHLKSLVNQPDSKKRKVITELILNNNVSNFGKKFKPRIYYSEVENIFDERFMFSGAVNSFGYFNSVFKINNDQQQYFRFDPVENLFIKIQLFCIDVYFSNGTSKNISSHELITNGVKKSVNEWVFYNPDPQIYFSCAEKCVSQIQIRGEINLLDFIEVYQNLNNELNRAKDELNLVMNTLKRMSLSRTVRWGNKIADVIRIILPKNSFRRKIVTALFHIFKVKINHIPDL
jgi:glycosyltransferase involved in cell wall biosynthesis